MIQESAWQLVDYRPLNTETKFDRTSEREALDELNSICREIARICVIKKRSFAANVFKQGH